MKKSTLVSEFKNELHSDGVLIKTLRWTVFTLAWGTFHRATARVERPGTAKPKAASRAELSILA